MPLPFFKAPRKEQLTHEWSDLPVAMFLSAGVVLGEKAAAPPYENAGQPNHLRGIIVIISLNPLLIGGLPYMRGPLFRYSQRVMHPLPVPVSSI